MTRLMPLPFRHYCIAMFAALTLTLAVITSPARADASESENTAFMGHFCDKATDTSQTLQCLKNELDYNKAKLNELFENISTLVSPDRAALMQKIQQKWLAYRDSECGWEESWGEGEALARIYELHCLAQLTAQRINRLQQTQYHNQQNNLPEFTPFPRWQTVLMQESGGLFWQFSETADFDTDCDGQINHVIIGLRHSGTNDASQETGDHIAVKTETVLGITHSSRTGRPDLYVLPLPATENGDFPAHCRGSLQLESVAPAPPPAAANIEQTAPKSGQSTSEHDENTELVAPKMSAKAVINQCRTKLSFTAAADCPSFEMIWHAGASLYDIIPPEIKNEEPESLTVETGAEKD